MANIDGLIGINYSTGTSLLLAAFGNDIVNVSTGLGYSANITSGNKGEFVSFLDNSWYGNGVETRRFNGTAWVNESSLRDLPVFKYASLSPRNRILFGYVSFLSQTFASRVWFTDFPKNGNVTYGLEYGTDLVQTAASKIVTSNTASFGLRNIKVGDPLIIVTGQNAGEYTVASIDSSTQITLTDTLTSTASGSSYWVGSNWFDVSTNNSDVITGLGQNSDRDLIFKLMSVHRYDGTSLRKLNDAVGTSSHRSIINHKGTTYYFHGSDPRISGIYATSDAITSTKISKPIEPFILGMNTTNYTEVVAWKEGDEIRFFLGDLTNTNEEISITNAVATLDTTTNSWDVGTIADVVKVATNFRTSNRLDWYTGTNDSQILQMNDGNSFNGSPIPFVVETKVFYPNGSEIINEIPYIEIISRNAKGVKVKYKLWDHPTAADDQWLGLGELTDDKTEFALPPGHKQSSGIQFRFEEDGSLENDMFIEKITIFTKPDRTRLV